MKLDMDEKDLHGRDRVINSTVVRGKMDDMI